MTQSTFALDLSEAGYIPDVILRRGIRLLLKQRLQEIDANDIASSAQQQTLFVDHMKDSPIALLTEKANEQHYEIPAEFYRWILGDYRKYSCCYWDEYTDSLTSAEELALIKTCEHADIENGMSILELGCGWGSLTLFMAETFPDSQITAVSNSHSQRVHIEVQAKARGLNNIDVITCDMNEFEPSDNYDRIVSVEMMEHMRNYQKLYERIALWLNDDGKFFKHIFVHRSTPYAFEIKDDSDWMSQYFFSGGMMPSDDLPLWFQHDLQLENRWRWNGQHYAKTAEAWLENMDENRSTLYPILENVYGAENAEKWWNRRRMFFMACAELFGYKNGNEWWVSHYLFTKR